MLEGAAVVVDVSNSPSFEDAAVLEFFETSTRHILDAMTAGRRRAPRRAVGRRERRLPDSGYLRAKVAQEKLIKTSAIPYSIVHATQFFEFISRIADDATEDGIVRLPSVLFQPGGRRRRRRRREQRSQLGAPVKGTIEIGGPEQFRFDELVRSAPRGTGRSARRSSPIPTLGTSAPSSANVHSCPATARCSPRPATRTGGRSRRPGTGRHDRRRELPVAGGTRDRRPDPSSIWRRFAR